MSLTCELCGKGCDGTITGGILRLNIFGKGQGPLEIADAPEHDGICIQCFMKLAEKVIANAQTGKTTTLWAQDGQITDRPMNEWEKQDRNLGDPEIN